MMRVYDCCIAHDEIAMLELRLAALRAVVDVFVVCEAGMTHSGQPKPPALADWALSHSNVRYVWVPTLAAPDSWAREREHRAAIAHGLRDAQPDDVVLVGDVDEIASPGAVALLRDQRPRAAELLLDFYYYNFNTRVEQGWSIGALRWGDGHNPNHIRTLTGITPELVIPRAGWHLSYFMTPERIVRKLDAFMHHADVAANVPRDADWIAQRIAERVDLYGRDLRLYPRAPEDPLPAPALNDPVRWAQWW